jgi:serine protease Do
MVSSTFKRSFIALAIAGAFATGTLVAEHASFSRPATAAAAPTAVVATAPAPVASALPDFADLVQKQGPAVVNIRTVQDMKKTAGRLPPGMPDLDELPPFFRGFPMPGPQQRGPAMGMGSGFIVSADGIVLTNAHVVADAEEVTVKLTDQREFKAKVLGSDKRTDVAVLKIDARDLPTVRIGDPATTRVGEWVVAIGAPYGLDNTVTSGIVSAKARALPGESIVPFIQTDAAVNPGNSGGPLFNLRGEVIGINSQIFSRSGGFQGLAFAIPIDVAMNVKDQIQTTGKVSHGRLGVTIQDVNGALAENFGLDKPRGALVGSVVKGGPAAKAGIEPGDVILKYDGREIARSTELPSLVAQTKPGATATVEVWRDGKARELKATIGESEETAKVAAAKPEAAQGKLGVVVRPLTAEEKKEADVPNGVVVEDVAGPAAKAGVQPGDVIVSVNSTPVRSPEQLRELVGKAGKTVALLVQRDDARIFIPVTIG